MVPRTLAFCFLCVLWQCHSLPVEEDDFPDPLGHFSHGYKRLDKNGRRFTTPKRVPSSSCTGLDDETGRCGYLKRCFTDEYRSNFALAMSHSCTIDRTYVGVCCSSHHREAPGNSGFDNSFASVLPVIAVDVRESIDETVSSNSSRIVWTGEGNGSKPHDSGEVNKNPERTRGCGTSPKTHGRLVGGRPADPNEWPWMAALLRKGETQYCGGVLITDRHVLTAAHCVYRSNPRDIKVRLGEYDFSSPEETRALDFTVVETRVHRDFDYTTYENDIAIAKMHRPTVFNSYIWPVCLPPIDQTFENKNAVVTGWGTQYYGGPTSTVLMEVAVPIWSQDKCTRSFVQRIPRTTMCAGGYEGGRDACQGDSGGPLLHQLGNGRWVNVGIVSWGIRCGEPGLPGIYTRVSSFLGWIFENAVF